MLKPRTYVILITASLLSSAVQSFAQTIPAKEDEARLIAVLKSNASHKQKADACRQLAVIGTKNAVAPLAALLGDEQLSHMARYGLEAIPGPAVDDALRAALGRVKGRPLVGIIGSIGVRRDDKAVRPLLQMLPNHDLEIARAAARALGSIGTLEVASALKDALQNASGENQLALCEGLFRCAEVLVGKDQRDEAIDIYDYLRGLRAPPQVRAGAVRGAILTREEGNVALLREYLRSNDYFLFSAAVQTARELPGTEITLALASELDDLPPTHRILVIQRLGKRADPAALPALFALSRKGGKDVRLEAIRALSQIGDGSAVPVLVELLADSDRQISQTAQESLAALPGRQAHAAVMEMLDSNQTSQRLIALELIGRRRMTSSMPALLRAAGDADPEVRPAALRRVGELGGPAEFPALLDLLMQPQTPQDLDAVEQALKAVCVKVVDRRIHVARVTNLLAQAGPAQKGPLLRVLSALGGVDALKAVSSATRDADRRVREAAIRSLCAWKTALAAPDLLAIAKEDANVYSTIALRGYIGLIHKGLTTEKKLAMCKQAAPLIRRDEEVKLLFGVLATVPAPEALDMAMMYLNKPAIKDETSFAAIAISQKIVERNPREVVDALQKVLKATNNREVARRAAQILAKAGRVTGR
ncbi:MAG: HEAT repeat domain-containing protein [Phycisphaerae bacterium]|nr:HEAT repeat domain-containing protein [Phycisphaerae bacterium]